MIWFIDKILREFKMTKKLFAKIGTTVGALLVSTVAVQANAGINSGFYAGASAGLSSLSGNQRFNAQENANPVVVTDARNNGLSATSAGAAVFGGYGHKWNCTWMAAELYYLYDRLNSDRTAQLTGTTEKTFQARSTGAFGVSIHLGYIPHPNCVVYAIAGVERRRFQMGLLNAAFVAADNIVSLESKKYNSTAFVPGAGMLLKLTKNMGLRAEYKYALHPSKTVTATADLAGTNNTSTLKQNPHVQTFHVGVVYSF